jgi:hypothetical protein
VRPLKLSFEDEGINRMVSVGGDSASLLKLSLFKNWASWPGFKFRLI